MVKCITELPEHSEISLKLLSCLGLLGCLGYFSNQWSGTIVEALMPPLSLSGRIVIFLSKKSNVFGLHFDKYCSITIAALCGYVMYNELSLDQPTYTQPIDSIKYEN